MTNKTAVAPLTWSSETTKDGYPSLRSTKGIHYFYRIILHDAGTILQYGRPGPQWTELGETPKVQDAIRWADNHNAEPTF